MFSNIVFILICGFFYIDTLCAFERFPPLTPNQTGHLQVDERHQIYWEESGNPKGFPVLFLHGGPGVGTNATDRTFFDPRFYRIILFDQRGCGQSTPNGCLENNSTWDLVNDIDTLLETLAIDHCLLFGGSWGSTLALAYAIQHPEKVAGLILRGIFLSRKEELDWFYRQGANHLSPKAWQIFITQVPKEKRGDLIAAYHELLYADSSWTKMMAAAAWVLWEFANMQSVPDRRLDLLLNSKSLFELFALLYSYQNLNQARIENHFFLNKGFFETDNWILDNIHRIQHIPGIIIQGENDQICPWENAQELHSKWPASLFFLIPHAGHVSSEPGILEALIQATEDFKTVLT